MVAILRGNVQQGGFVADMVITGGIAGNILTSPINANALPATFDGSSIFALNASNVSTGVLGVARGGTGTTTSTGSGNVVLSNNPVLQGNVGIGTANPQAALDMGSTTDSIILPQGVSRPSGNSAGQMRYNSLHGVTESYDGRRWMTVSQQSSYAAPADPILALDAENSASYPGSGTTWTNLVGGGSSNGTMTSVTYTAGSSSTPGYMSFNGTSSYVAGTLNNTAGAWAHSVSCWVYWDSDPHTASGRQVFAIGNVNGFSQYSAFLTVSSRVSWFFYDNDVNISSNVFTAGQWYHIVLTYNGGDASATNKSMYINNQYRAFTGRTGTGTGPLNLAANAQINIGRDVQRNQDYFPGKIANFQVWNRALTASEIDSLFNAQRYRFRTQPTVTGGLTLTSGISILPDDPGTFIEKRYGIGNATNRYGLGQYPFGIFRFYNANVYSGTWNFCRSTGENTFTDVAIVDSAGGFTIIGNGYKPGGGSWAASSDIRIKENVQNANVDLCYDSVKNLPLKRFEYTRDYLDKNPSVEDTHVVGWVADDVMGVFPKSVKEIDAFGYSNLKTLDVDQLYKTMWGALTKVIRDKEALEARLAAAGL